MAELPVQIKNEEHPFLICPMFSKNIAKLLFQVFY